MNNQRQLNPEFEKLLQPAEKKSEIFIQRNIAPVCWGCGGNGVHEAIINQRKRLLCGNCLHLLRQSKSVVITEKVSGDFALKLQNGRRNSDDKALFHTSSVISPNLVTGFSHPSQPRHQHTWIDDANSFYYYELWEYAKANWIGTKVIQESIGELKNVYFVPMYDGTSFESGDVIGYVIYSQKGNPLYKCDTNKQRKEHIRLI